MRLVFVIIAAVIVVGGLLMTEMPLASQAGCSGSIIGNGAYPLTCTISSLIVPLEIVVNWQTGVEGNLTITACNSVHTAQDASGQPINVLTGCSSSVEEAGFRGGSGVTSFSIPGGGVLQFQFAPVNSGNATVKTVTSVPAVGIPMVVVGAGILVLGVVLKERSAESPTPDEEPSDSEEPSEDAEAASTRPSDEEPVSPGEESPASESESDTETVN